MGYHPKIAGLLLSNEQAYHVVRIAQQTGEHIMRRLGESFERYKKADDSNVTDIDYETDRFIKEELLRITPGIPVLSEEDSLPQQQELMRKGMYWCIDPLDGTSAAIAYADGDKHKTYFGTQIALVKDGVPVFGVSHFPAQQGGLTYFSNAACSKAYKQQGKETPREITVRELPQLFGAFRSYSALSGVETTSAPIHGIPLAQQESWGDRNLMIAEGKTDIGYRTGHPTRPPGCWDVAAPHAILRAAGGEIFTAPFDADALGKQGLAESKLLRYTEEGLNGKPYVGGVIAGSIEALARLGLHVPETMLSFRLAR